MTLALRLEGTDIPEKEIQETVQAALRAEAIWAKARREFFSQQCQEFENQFGLSSVEFFDRFEGGQLGDDEVYFDWYAVKRGYDLWSRRYMILSRVSF